MTTFKAKNCVVLVKKETTKGTDANPDGSNAIFAIEVDWSIDGDPLINEEMHEGSQKRVGGGLGNPIVNFTITTYLRGSGTDAGGGTPDVPTFDPLLLASRMSYSAGVYSPDWDVDDSVTIYCNWGGKRYKCVGAQCSWKLLREAGKYDKIEFTGMGKYVEPDEAAVPTPSVTPGNLNIAKSCAFSLGDITTDLMSATKFDLDYGNKPEVAYNLNASDGVEEINSMDERESVIETDPLILSTADSVNLYSDWVDGGSLAFSILSGDTALHKFTFAGTCEVASVPMGERAGKLSHEGASFRLVSDTKDGDLTITLS